MKVEILDQEQKFKPVEIKLIIESEMELNTIVKLLGSAYEITSPGSREIFRKLKDLTEYK